MTGKEQKIYSGYDAYAAKARFDFQLFSSVVSLKNLVSV